MPDHSYEVNHPRGWMGDPKRGSSFGRTPRHATPDFAGELVVRRVVVEDDGYDRLGTYWGTGKPLFWYADADGMIDSTCRADSSELALLHVKNKYPNAQLREDPTNA